MTEPRSGAESAGGSERAQFGHLLADGQLAGGLAPMTRGQVLEALQLMLLSRAIDELAIKMQRLRRIGLYAPVYGQEAAVIGSAMALNPLRDWMVPASREQPAMIRHGLPLQNFFASYMGRLDYAAIPDGIKLLPRQQAIGAQIPHAAGLAWALMLNKVQAVTMVYCGDGASSEGDFHEALNFAGVMRAPLVVVIINNQYAISTPYHKQTAALSLADRAAGYGFPGVSVDGDDLFAVYDAASAAVQRALDGQGPSLIECRTYRVGFHNTSDNPRDYRADEELRLALTKDPVARVERYALNEELVTDAALATLKHEVQAELAEVQRHVATLPRPSAAAIFDHVFDSLPAYLDAQRRELKETE